MAYDYDVDILAALWTGIEDAKEPYASFIAANPTLTDEVSENRILSTIELVRSHIELIQNRNEAKLLRESISKLITHTAGGSNPFSSSAAITVAKGNVCNPTFPAGASFTITIDGVVTMATSASGGDCATVAAELNVTLDAPIPAATEVTDIVADADADGNKGGTYFTINSAGDATAYYAWMSHGGRLEESSITTIADVDGSLGETFFFIFGSGSEIYHVWLSHDGAAETSTVNASADVGGNKGGLYFNINSAGDATAYYVWLSHPGLAEITNVVPGADTGGDLGGTYFTLNSAGDAVSYYVWMDHAGLAERSTVTAVADTAGSLSATYFTLNNANDVTAFYVWMSHIATAGFADAAVATAPAGSVVPGLAAATYDFDVTIDGGGNQPLSITTVGGEDYDALAALMSAVPVAGGTVAFTGGAFRITSSSTGASSAATVAAGTFGSGGGDLFAAITVATANAVTFPAATAGLAATVDPAPGGTGIEIVYTVNDTAATIGGLLRTEIDLVVGFGTSGGGATCTITNAGSGPSTNAADTGGTGFGIVINIQGLAPAVDPAPGGGLVAIAVGYSVGDTAPTVGAAIATDVGALGAFGTSGTSPVIITNAAVGDTTDAADVDTGFGVTTPTQGVDVAVDPTPGGTAIAALYSIGDNAGAIGTAIATAVGALGDFGTAGSDPVIITNAAIGVTTDSIDGNTGFAIATTQQGLAVAESDPSAEGTGVEVPYTVNATALTIANALWGAIDPLEGLQAEGAGNPSLPKTFSPATSDVTDTVDVDTGFTITTLVQGVDAAVDPAPGGGLTGIPVMYSVDDTAPAIATAISAAIGALGDFSTEGIGSTATVSNTATGLTTDAADVSTEFVITVITQGADAVGDAVPVQAFCVQPGNKLGIRGQEDFVTFDLSNGTGGIIGPAGIIPGPRPSTPKKVANKGRDTATQHLVGTPRPADLTP